MSDIPGLETDVFFGAAKGELPDWRKETPAEQETDEPESNAETLAALYGYDPSWFEDQETSDDADTEAPDDVEQFSKSELPGDRARAAVAREAGSAASDVFDPLTRRIDQLLKKKRPG